MDLGGDIKRWLDDWGHKTKLKQIHFMLTVLPNLEEEEKAKKDTQNNTETEPYNYLCPYCNEYTLFNIGKNPEDYVDDKDELCMNIECFKNRTIKQLLQDED